MNNYVHHLGLTAWRRKSALLIAVTLLSLIVFGLQFSRVDEKPGLKDEGPQAIAEAFASNVRFLESNLKPETVRAVTAELNLEEFANLEQPSRDEIARRRSGAESLETEQQMGIPYVSLSGNNPYIPKKRLVHLDLKGAPPVVSFFKKFFPLIRNLGATGILLEYEDMFPYNGVLENITAKNAYTSQQVTHILDLAEKSQLEIIPLIQTFGHMEFALKHPEWAKLREVPGSPQALCPSRNASLTFLKEMVSQFMALHPKIKHLHIGCDEVFQMGECDICRLELHENLFLKHVQNVANLVHEKFPHLRLIIWDDMLRHVSQQSMLDANLGSMVEPMVWVYAEDIYRFVQPPVWDKYSAVFKTAWAASAFKGAFGETLFVPDSRRHLENNLRWLEVMSQQEKAFKRGFAGLALTGWQRYDHFAVLCELLPAGIPSLALDLLATTHGFFNSSLKSKFLSGLSCPQHNQRNQPFINLDADPFLWDKLGRCMFPGSSFFRLTYRLHTMETEVDEFVRTTKRHKGWMTDYNVRHNYSLPLRVDELSGDLPRIYHGVTSLVRAAVDAMVDVFDNYTISEWIEQKIYPYVIELEKIQNQSIALRSVNQWPSRPLPPLRDLQSELKKMLMSIFHKMSSKLEVQWAPTPNKFITWGSEICLYEVHKDRDHLSQSMKLSSSTSANLLATNTNHHYVKCLDIYPKSETDLLLAVGLSNGRVSLSTFGPTEYDALGLPGKELVPRHARQCNAVCWNMIETNWVAAGLDKYRSDNSVLIWDITKSSQNDNNSGRLAVNTMAPGVELAKPIAEFGVSETAHSMAWFSSNSKLIAVGMNLKNIKFVDIRDPNKITNSTLTKAVFGVCMDPNDDRHLASFFENNIYVWDTRNFEKPILTLHHNKPVIKIGWCPTKYNLLSALQKESSVINLYDIQHTIIGNEEVEPSVLERDVIPGSPHNIMSFSWHNSEENRFLTIALSGTITDYTVFDRITLNWAPTSNVVWTYGRKTMKYINDYPLQDISTKIKQRALAGYGLKAELYKNGEIVDNEMLANVWNWLFLSGKLVEDGLLNGAQCKHPGVQAVLKLDPGNNKSDHYSLLWSDLGNKNCQGVVRIFKHEDRDRALHLCSWHFERDSNKLTAFLEQLEKEQAYTRAAAIAVFNLKIRLAIDILSRAPEDVSYGLSLNVVAMALAGFTDDKSSVWKQFCSTAKQKLSDPYLKVIFSFLTAENYIYESVLNESGVTVDDRVAFACMFLPDNRLHDYLKKLSDKLIEEGNLDGLLLTGTNLDGIRLLQRYLDATGDIQSTALIAVRAFPVELYSDAIKEWISSYRNLLDTWQLWNERAHFDIMLSTYWPADTAPQQVYVSCNFCGKSISAFMYGLTRGRGPFSRIGGTANKLKMSSCPNCRKPLPRCAICLMHMGTTSGGSSGSDASKVIEFPNWFTWCQTCRHGGHVSHMTHWFE